MPNSQVASVQNYDFAAPATADTSVLKFGVRKGQGGLVSIRFENQGANTLTASVKTSTDGTTFTATDASGNAVAVTDITVKPSCHADYTVLVGAADTHFQVTASGETRASAQMRDGGIFNMIGRADRDAILNF
jgi:hypothetical protein